MELILLEDWFMKNWAITRWLIFIKPITYQIGGIDMEKSLFHPLFGPLPCDARTMLSEYKRALNLN